jgi:hypothetical protein
MMKAKTRITACKAIALRPIRAILGRFTLASLALLAVTFLAQACMTPGPGSSECHVVSEWEMTQAEIMPYAKTGMNGKIKAYHGCPMELDLFTLKKGVTEDFLLDSMTPEGSWYVILSQPDTDDVQSAGAEVCVYHTMTCPTGPEL